MSEAISAELDALYKSLDADVARAGPRCDLSGRCCRFAEYGHTLFVSRLEADRLLGAGLPEGAAVDPGGCPFQVERLCTARDRRPIGCRVFFCDPAYSRRQSELSEMYIRRIKELHDRHGIPWEYRPLHWWLDRE